MATRTLLRAALAVALAVSARPIAAQEGVLGDLAQLLALEDRRQYDGLALERAALHPDTIVRVRAAMAMGRIGDRTAVPVLLRMLADPDSGVRAEAAFALGELGDRTAASELVRILEGFPAAASGALADEVVTALAKIGGGEVDAALDRLLERHPPDGPARDRATAMALLESWRLGDSSRVVARLPEYVRRAHGDWRRHATYSATRLRLVAAGPALLDAARDPDPLTRQYAARGLLAPVAERSGAGRGVFADRLRSLLDDPDAQVRTNAVRALGTFEDSALVPLAAARLLDRDPNAQIQAAQTLRQLGGSRSALALAQRFPGAHTFALRRALLLALAPLDSARALALAAPWRADADWRTRAGWGEVLAAAGRAHAAGLVAQLDDADPRVIADALGALAQLLESGDTMVAARARGLLEHADVMVRATAIGIVGRGDGAPVDVVLAAWRRAEADALDDGRLAALEALGRLVRAQPALADAIAERFFALTPPSREDQVRRAVARVFGAATLERRWGPVVPVETGRSAEDYRDLVRRYVLRTAPAAGRVTIETERGSIELQLFGYEAPVTVDNFLRLVERRFYDGGRWHRVVPNFVAQDGDPRGDGRGGPGTTIRDEINRRRYGRGTVGMALSGPDTGGSQFFICHSPQPHLDGGYTVFGEVRSGLTLLDQVVQGDRIRRITPR